MKTIAVVAALLIAVAVAHAQTGQIGPGIMTNPPALPPSPPPTAPESGAMPVPPEWNQGGQPPSSPMPINLIGKWTYQIIEENIPQDVLIIFQPNGQYNQFIRFPRTPVFGRQIVQVWGSYIMQGSSVTIIPAGSQVSNGPNPQQLCNITTNLCTWPNIGQARTFEMQRIDDNTIQTPLGIAKRLPQ